MNPLDLDPAIAARGGGPGAGTPPGSARKARRSGFRRFLSTPGAAFGSGLLAAMLAIAILGPVLRPGDPLLIVGDAMILPFTDPDHVLGTDSLGRDLLSGVLNGARVSLSIGMIVALLSLGFGLLVGAVAGYAGGRVDELICRFIEIFQTIPGFVLLVVLVALLEPSTATLILGLTLVSWDTVARLARAEFRNHRNRDYVQAARAMGHAHRHIIFREILPNIAPALIVTGSIIVASAILSESALSFLGLGDPNTITWGSLIGAGREQIRTHWYLTAIPGFFIALTVLALNLLGDALNDFLDPRGRDRDG